MKSIDIFPWDNHFETGLPLIDTQHRRLVDLLNQLAREVASQTDTVRLYQIFDELLDYTVYHFEAEERIWGRYFSDDPLEAEHIALHHSFIDTIVELKIKNNQTNSLEIAEETLGFLARWLASHILETDRHMAYIVLALENGASMDAAKIQAQESMSGFTRTLIDLILSIYETLSTNTLQLLYEIRKQKQLEETIVEHEHELRIREEYQRTVLDNFPFLVWLKDTEGRFLTVNQHFVHVFEGITADNIIGKTDFDIWPNDLAQAYRNDDMEVIQSGHAKNVEEEVEFKGKRRWMETYKSPVFVDGIVIGTVGFARDITQRKEVEVDVIEANNLLHTIIDTMPVRIFWKDLQSRYMGCNTLFAHDAGLSDASELIGKDDYEMGWSDQADLYRADDLGIIQSGTSRLFYEEPQTTPAGETIWLSTSKVPLKNYNDEIIGVVVLYDDITVRKESEATLRLAASVFAHSREGILITSEDGTIIEVNNAFTRITGYRADEVIGKNPNILKSGRQGKEFYSDLWNRLNQKGHWYGEVWNRRKNGEVYAELLTISTVFQEDGDIKTI